MNIYGTKNRISRFVVQKQRLRSDEVQFYPRYYFFFIGIDSGGGACSSDGLFTLHEHCTFGTENVEICGWIA